MPGGASPDISWCPNSVTYRYIHHQSEWTYLSQPTYLTNSRIPLMFHEIFMIFHEVSIKQITIKTQLKSLKHHEQITIKTPNSSLSSINWTSITIKSPWHPTKSHKHLRNHLIKNIKNTFPDASPRGAAVHALRSALRLGAHALRGGRLLIVMWMGNIWLIYVNIG
jgi:hypothetical protein